MGSNGKMIRKNKAKATSRLQIRIPVVLKEQLENVVEGNIMGINNSKSLIVGIALANLFNEMESSSIEDVYTNSYIPYLQGDD